MEGLPSRENTIFSCLDQLVPAVKREHILHTGNFNLLSTFNRYHGYNHEVVTLFERTVSRYSEGIAVTRGLETLTYRNVDLAANSVAKSLASVQTSEPPCVIADYSINSLVPMLGILKAQGFHVPLAPNVPKTVRDENYKRCGSQIFIVTVEATISTSPSTALQVLVIEHILRTNQQPQKYAHA